MKKTFTRHSSSTEKQHLPLLVVRLAALVVFACSSHPLFSQTLQSVSLSPAALPIGNQSTGTVTLSSAAPAGGATVTLSTSDSKATHLPANVVVPAQGITATFVITTSSLPPGTSTETVTISAIYAGVTKTATLTLFVGLSFSPGSVAYGQPTTGTVTLASPVPTGQTVSVSLSSSNQAVFPVPSSLVLTAGQSSKTFVVTPTIVTANTSITVTATYTGFTATAAVTVWPTSLASVTLSAASVIGGTPVSLKILLTNPAPPAGQLVLITGLSRGCPSSLTIPAGSDIGTLTCSTAPVSTDTILNISISANGGQLLALVTTAGPSILSLTTAQPEALSGQSLSATITLNAPAPEGGATVNLSSLNSSIAHFRSATAFIPAGLTTGVAQVDTGPTTGAATLTAGYGRYADLNVTVTAVIVPLSIRTSLSPITHGSIGYYTITLDAVDCNGGAVSLTSSHPEIFPVPSSVPWPCSDHFDITLPTITPAPGSTVVTLSATRNGSTASQNVIVAGAPIASAISAGVQTAPPGTLHATLALIGTSYPSGTQIPVWSSNPALASVPASITTNGSATYDVLVTLSTPTVPSLITLSAAYGGMTVRSDLIVTPTVSLNGLALETTELTGAAFSITGDVSLNGPAPSGGIIVTLANSQAAIITMPTSITVAQGLQIASFTITTQAVSTDTSATITAIAAGISLSAPLTVLAPTVSAVTLAPDVVTAGGSVVATAVLSGPAPTAGLSIPISASSTEVQGTTFPTLTNSSLPIAAGSSSGSFTVQTIPQTIQGCWNFVDVSACRLLACGTGRLWVYSSALLGLSLSPATVQGGQPSTAIITLNGTPDVPATVQLTSTPAGIVTMPTSVVIAGVTGQVAINTSVVSADTAVTITATYGASSGGGSVQLQQVLTVTKLATLQSLTLTPAMIIGGNTATGTVLLDGPAPSGGAIVSLTKTGSSAVAIPSSVTVAASQQSKSFNVTTTAVSSAATANITAAYGGISRPTTITVLPTSAATLAAVSVNPSTVPGGTNSTGTVTLTGPAPSGGATVSLSSSNPSVASVPATATISTGLSGPFPVTTYSVSAQTAVTITAVYGSTTARTTTITVTPPSAAAVTSVTLSPQSVAGGETSTGTVSLSAAAPSGGLVVALSSSNSAVAIPDNTTVTVPQGYTAATFSISTFAATSSSVVTITAVGGGSSRSASLTVNAATFSGVAFAVPSTVGGSYVALTASLSGITPSGVTIALSSSNSALPVPASISVGGGRSKSTAVIATTQVATDTVITVTATLGAIVRTAQIALTVAPELLSAGTTTPALPAGQVGEGFVTLNGPAPSAGMVVALTSSDPTAVIVPANVTIPQDSDSIGFDITIPAQPLDKTVTITATAAGKTATFQQDALNVGISSVTATPASIPAGTSSTGQVTLSSSARLPVEVFLTSANPDLVQVPGSVVIANSATGTFPITTSGVGSNTSVSISATFQDPSELPVLAKSEALATGTVTVTTSSPPQLASLQFPAGVGVSATQYTVTGYVKLTSQVTTPVTVAITSLDPLIATAPPTVTITSGYVGTFPVTMTPMVGGTARFTATYGTVSLTRSVGVAPPSTFSYYVTPTGYPGNLQAMGCDTATRMLANGLTEGAVILDFGAATRILPDIGGTRVYGATLHSSSANWKSTYTLAQDVYTQYYLGFIACESPSDVGVTLILATNTTGKHENYTEHAAAWSGFVDALNDGYGSGLVVGGNDMEPDVTKGWATPSLARQWIDSWIAQPFIGIWNPNECVYTGAAVADSASPWKKDDYYYCAQGGLNVFGSQFPMGAPMPQIYNTRGKQASIWHDISAYAATAYNDPILFGGALTQQQACIDLNDPCTGRNNPPSQGWYQLFSDIAADPATAAGTEFMNWSTDIAWFPNAGTIAKEGELREVPSLEDATSELRAKYEAGRARLAEHLARVVPQGKPADPAGSDGEESGIMSNQDIYGPIARKINLQNWYQGRVDGAIVAAYAGSERHLRTSPLLLVQALSPDGMGGGPLQAYRPPNATGMLRIVSSAGDLLVLATDDGSQYAFDLRSRQWQ